jgi:hypothetical protein
VFESFGFVAVYLGDLATAAAPSRRAARRPGRDPVDFDSL